MSILLLKYTRTANKTHHVIRTVIDYIDEGSKLMIVENHVLMIL